mmetsp:Transcript_14225/g.16812  ORF Transcript_14225/g.16812 Transcript_14225/m.16812 type:complete len:376 (+) Transcript_14225:475-1602(+)
MKLYGLLSHQHSTTTTILFTITILSSPQHQSNGFALAPPSHTIPAPTLLQSLHNNHNHNHINDNSNSKHHHQHQRRHRSSRTLTTTRFAAATLGIPLYSDYATYANDTTSTTTTTTTRRNATSISVSPPMMMMTTTTIPHCIESTVLKQVYPAILKHIEEYGNPNIPLGTKDGKRCKILRRMAFQQTLSPEEIQLLDELDFRWNNFEDVYEEADFDACLNRLIKYEEEQKSNYQIPKKYHPDPELGAWVTLIRRLGKANIESKRRDKLDAIGFTWKSTRKCGSSFMSAYKAFKGQCQSVCRITSSSSTAADTDTVSYELIDSEGLRTIVEEASVQKWLRTTRDAFQSGKLSDSRCVYMDQLPGFDWRQWVEDESE